MPFKMQPFTFWTGVYLATPLFIPAGLFGYLGLIAISSGLVDLAIGRVYMSGLPKELGVSHADLLYDRLG